MNTFHFFEFYEDLLAEGDEKHCVMVGLPKFSMLTNYINNIPEEYLYRPKNRKYGRESMPHITVLYGIKPHEEYAAKDILSKIPGKLVATLGKVSLFENCKSDDGGVFDVLKIDVESPDLAKINKKLRSKVEYESDHPKYHPHVTIAYLKPGKGKEYVGEDKFEGKKFLFEVFLYSDGNRDEHAKVPMMAEYFVGQSGGYGGATGGSVAASGWAGTYSGPETSGRVSKYQDDRRGSYMQGNTVVNNSLYDTIRPEDLKDPRFSPDEMMAGYRYEMKHMEYPDKNKARPIVLANLEKNPRYYSDLGEYHMVGKY